MFNIQRHSKSIKTSKLSQPSIVSNKDEVSYKPLDLTNITTQTIRTIYLFIGNDKVNPCEGVLCFSEQDCSSSVIQGIFTIIVMINDKDSKIFSFPFKNDKKIKNTSSLSRLGIESLSINNKDYTMIKEKANTVNKLLL